MKIAVPWPFLKMHQARIRESLNLWRRPEALVVCLPEPCDDPFLSKFDTRVMLRNTGAIGSHVQRCYLDDMLRAALSRKSEEDWYGIGDSDIVPHVDFYTETTRFEKSAEAVAYHALEVSDWDKTYAPESDLRRPRLLLFRKHVAATLANEFFTKHDLAVAATGCYERVCRWLRTRFNVVRRTNKLFHKIHTSDWDEYEPESLWNGGAMSPKEEAEAYDFGCLSEANVLGAGHKIPRHVRHVLRRRNPELYRLVQK